jgi:hypothetical protein
MSPPLQSGLGLQIGLVIGNRTPTVRVCVITPSLTAPAGRGSKKQLISKGGRNRAATCGSGHPHFHTDSSGRGSRERNSFFASSEESVDH